jgi:RHS repeat-associated protein
MPASPREPLLCRYHYDALNRLDNSAPSAMDSLQHFYCKTRLATEIQGSVRNSIFQHEDQLLAQQRHENARIGSSLLATDQQRSVLNALCATGPQPAAYTPYGHRSPENGMLSLLGFNGERRDRQTGHYPLGNGYRQFNPELMRFNSPDSLSPFGDGGLNAYGYCVGDPVNRSDPTGHFSVLNVSMVISGIFSSGALLGALVVEDETTRWVLMGVAAATAIFVGGGAVMKARQSMMTQHLQTRSFSDPPPPYPGSRQNSQDAGNRASVSEQPPPSYQEANRSMGGLRNPPNSVLQPSLSSPQPRRRTLSSSSLSSSDNTQEARHVRRNI